MPSNQAALLNVSSAFWITILGNARAAPGHPVACWSAPPHDRRRRASLILWPGGSEMAAPGAAALVGWSRETVSARLLAGATARDPARLLRLGRRHRHLLRRRDQPDWLSFTGLQMFVGGLMLFVPATVAGDFAAWH